MSMSSSTHARPGFKIRLHFLRREGEHTYNISNPIVAFEDADGNFSPRRPEPGETHEEGPSFYTLEELTAYLWDRERNHIDHDALWHNEHFLGISPFYEFIRIPEKVAPHGYYGCNSGWHFESFQRGVTLELANFRHWALLAAEFKFICTQNKLVYAPSADRNFRADAADMIGFAEALRSDRWPVPHKALSATAPRCLREAQLWLPRFNPSTEFNPVRTADDWS